MPTVAPAVFPPGCRVLQAGQRRLCIEASRVTVVHPVYPRHTNRYGTLHGGQLASWVLEAGGMAAMKAARGYVVLGAIDHLFILSPGRVGENLFTHAWVIGSTRHTLDVLVYAEAYPRPGEEGEPRPVSLSLQTFVAVNEDVRPRVHGLVVEPCSLESEPVARAHREWLEERRGLVEERRRLAHDLSPLDAVFRVESYKFVSPADEFTLPGVLDASRLFQIIDEVAAATAIRYAGVPMVTASFDAAVFASPARTGDLLRLEAGITGAGKSSLEAAVKIFAENPVEGRRAAMAQLYVVFVSVGPDGRPRPLPRRPVLSPEKQEAFTARRRMREERRRRVSELVKAVRSMLVPAA